MSMELMQKKPHRINVDVILKLIKVKLMLKEEYAYILDIKVICAREVITARSPPCKAHVT